MASLNPMVLMQHMIITAWPFSSIHIRVTLWWVQWRLKSPASRLFTQPFIQTQIKENIKAPRLAFVRGVHRGPVNSPHKVPVTRKMFPFDDVIMILNMLWKFFADGSEGVFYSRGLSMNISYLQLAWPLTLCWDFLLFAIGLMSSHKISMTSLWISRQERALWFATKMFYRTFNGL